MQAEPRSRGAVVNRVLAQLLAVWADAVAAQALNDLAKQLGVMGSVTVDVSPPPEATRQQLRASLSPREFALRMRRDRGSGPQHAKRWWQR